MRRVVTLALVCLALPALMAQAALADNPHFSWASADGPDAAGNLSVSFRMAGLGNAGSVATGANADARATYACQKNGEGFPKKVKRTSVFKLVSANGFSSGTGQLTGSLTLRPPSADLQCSKKQHKVLVSVSYDNVSVSGAGATRGIAGTYSRQFFSI